MPNNLKDKIDEIIAGAIHRRDRVDAVQAITALIDEARRESYEQGFKQAVFDNKMDTLDKIMDTQDAK